MKIKDAKTLLLTSNIHRPEYHEADIPCEEDWRKWYHHIAPTDAEIEEGRQ